MPDFKRRFFKAFTRVSGAKFDLEVVKIPQSGALDQ
jgi:hypothetical protein